MIRRLLDYIVRRQNSAVYQISHYGRDRFLYREGDHQLIIHANMLKGEYDFAIYPRSVKEWLPPFQEEEIDTQKKREILNRLYQWLKDQSIQYVLEYEM